MTPNHSHDTPHLPSPTPWPMVLALGMTLAAAGLVTQIAVSAIGALILVTALAMLIREDIRQQPGDRT